VGSLALTFNAFAIGNTAEGTGALLANDADVSGTAVFNTAVGAGALLSNVDGFSNSAVGNAALASNVIAVSNTAFGDDALAFNDGDALGLGNFNTAVGTAAMFNNIDGFQNTVVGTGAGPNLVAGGSNTYVGQFVGSTIGDEAGTIRIADVSIDGFGSAECFIGGIFNNFQPVGGTVVEVTLDLSNDHLGWDVGPSQARPSVPTRSAPGQRGKSQPGARPQAPGIQKALQRQAMLGDKVEKLEATVAEQQATVAQQQKQIETLTAQLREQAEQIQKVSAQLEVSKPAPQVVANKP